MTPAPGYWMSVGEAGSGSAIAAHEAGYRIL